MSHNASKRIILQFLGVLKHVLQAEGLDILAGAGLQAAGEVLDQG